MENKIINKCYFILSAYYWNILVTIFVFGYAKPILHIAYIGFEYSDVI